MNGRLASIVSALQAKRAGKQQWVARCPAHADRSPSLAIREADGKILLHCHASCRQSEVIAALRARGLWEPAREAGHRHRVKDPDYAGDLIRAGYFRSSALLLSNQLLEMLDETDPERRGLTALRRRLDLSLLAEYRECRRLNPPFAAGLVRAGRLHEAREQSRLAQWIMEAR